MTSDTTINLVRAIQNKDIQATRQAFNDEIRPRLAAVMDREYKAMAASIVSPRRTNESRDLNEGLSWHKTSTGSFVASHTNGLTFEIDKKNSSYEVWVAGNEKTGFFGSFPTLEKAKSAIESAKLNPDDYDLNESRKETKCPGSGKPVVEGSGMGPDDPVKGKTRMECSVCGKLVVVPMLDDDDTDTETFAPVHTR